jgi:hypothetical protein
METKEHSTSEQRPLTNLAIPGIVLTVPAALFAARIVWEETFLTIREGPQMIGFAIAHIFPIAFLAPLPLMLWLVIAIVSASVALVRRRIPSMLFWITFAAAVSVTCSILLPQQFWQWTFTGSFVKGGHAADLMAEDAAEGYTRTVRAFLNHGLDSSAAMNAAAIGGHVPVLQLLVSRGANVNTVNRSGYSPLADAIDAKRDSSVAYLKAQGAREIRPVKPPLPPADATVTVDGGKQ